MQVNWNPVDTFWPPALTDVLVVVFDPTIDPEPTVIMAFMRDTGTWFMTPTEDPISPAIVTHWAPIPALPEAL